MHLAGVTRPPVVAVFRSLVQLLPGLFLALGFLPVGLELAGRLGRRRGGGSLVVFLGLAALVDGRDGLHGLGPLVGGVTDLPARGLEAPG